MGCSPWSRIELDTIERLAHTHTIYPKTSHYNGFILNNMKLLYEKEIITEKKKNLEELPQLLRLSPHHYQKRGHLIQIKLTGLIKLSHYRQSQFLQYDVSPKGTGTTCDFRKT